MTPRYIDIDGKKLRVEFNWNTTILFLDSTGMTLDVFAGLATGAQITPRHIRALALCGVIEGERCDGREFEIDEVSFGAMLRPATINEVMAIFADHFTGVVPEEAKKKGRLKQILYRVLG